MSVDLIIPLIGLTPIEAGQLIPLIKQFINDWVPTIELTNIIVQSYGPKDTFAAVRNQTQIVSVDRSIYILIITELRLLSAFQGMSMIGSDPLDVYLAETQKLPIVRFHEYVLSSSIIDLSRSKAKLIDQGYRYSRHANLNLFGLDATLIWQHDGECVYHLSDESARRYLNPDLEYIHQQNTRGEV
jgi:hypothetical protein